ncbi:MarR family winged helix-turn-helix transcriptional regulator [Salibacter halophilus]|uniref:MarR family transcriptional regulator n=1 Tax=Salibacter halophilus TaxID=1803916 RepID=A0A6N6M6X1_9FLAO|nr:MarR family transcriptional regulator [Salibacter halophilus]KAB1063479.1 MarR family transcriptional regulator [Salibacter halophilus]
MKLEDEIKQKKFKTEYEKLLVNILFTSSWLNGAHLKFLKPRGLSQQQYNVLRILRGQHPDPASIGLISERMLDKNSNASRLVDKLLDKELIVRTTSKYDRRQKEIAITEKGLDLLEVLDEEFRKFQQQFHTLSVNEAENLNNLLDKLRG